MHTKARDRLQLGGWIRMAAALAILAMISIAPPDTNSRAIPDLAKAPAAERELAAPTAAAQVAPTVHAASKEGIPDLTP